MILRFAFSWLNSSFALMWPLFAAKSFDSPGSKSGLGCASAENFAGSHTTWQLFNIRETLRCWLLLIHMRIPHIHQVVEDLPRLITMT